MELQILKQGEQPVENYKTVFLYPNGDMSSITLQDVSDNECTEILAGDIFNFCASDQIQTCVDALMQKLRINGLLTIGGTDIRLFCKSVINNTIDMNFACNMISECRSMSTLTHAIEALARHKVDIVNTTMSASHYTVKARRLS